MAKLPHRPSMSIEEYLDLDRRSSETRYEYIDGYVRMLAGGTPDHAKIAANVIGVLYGVLGGMISSCLCSLSLAILPGSEAASKRPGTIRWALSGRQVYP